MRNCSSRPRLRSRGKLFTFGHENRDRDVSRYDFLLIRSAPDEQQERSARAFITCAFVSRDLFDFFPLSRPSASPVRQFDLPRFDVDCIRLYIVVSLSPRIRISLDKCAQLASSLAISSVMISSIFPVPYFTYFSSSPVRPISIRINCVLLHALRNLIITVNKYNSIYDNYKYI